MMDSKARIAIFLSGNGTNAERIIQQFKNHALIEVSLVLSNNPQAKGLERARQHHVPVYVFDKTQFRESDAVLNELYNHQITHVVLAGFLWLIPASLTKAFPGRIINIHPALLPKHGGKGMYGKKVHEAVKAAGDTQTGITIHEVNEHYDEGKVLFQAICEVNLQDSSEDIAEKVHQLEYAHYPKVIEAWVKQTMN